MNIFTKTYIVQCDFMILFKCNCFASYSCVSVVELVAFNLILIFNFIFLQFFLAVLVGNQFDRLSVFLVNFK